MADEKEGLAAIDKFHNTVPLSSHRSPMFRFFRPSPQDIDGRPISVNKAGEKGSGGGGRGGIICSECFLLLSPNIFVSLLTVLCSEEALVEVVVAAEVAASLAGSLVTEQPNAPEEEAVVVTVIVMEGAAVAVAEVIVIVPRDDPDRVPLAETDAVLPAADTETEETRASSSPPCVYIEAFSIQMHFKKLCPVAPCA